MLVMKIETAKNLLPQILFFSPFISSLKVQCGRNKEYVVINSVRIFNQESRIRRIS